MICGNKTTNSDLIAVDLQKDLQDTNLRTMALNTGSGVLDQVGGSVQFGKRQDWFWIAMTIILGTVLILSKLFSRKRKKR